MHPNVEFVRIQWRKTGVGEWINAWDIDWSSWEDITDADGKLLEKTFGNFFNKYPFDGKESSRRKQMQELLELDIHDADSQCATSRGAGCTLKWNLARQYFLSGLNDGSYEVRAKVFCSGYDSFATADVRGSVTDEPLSLSVDVNPPIAISTHTLDRAFSVEYSEPIKCPEMKEDAMPHKIRQVKDCNGNPVTKNPLSDTNVYLNFRFVCMTESSFKLVIEFPKTVPDGTYEITINENAGGEGEKVVDLGGNPAEKQMFFATVGHSCVSGSSGTSNLGISATNESNGRSPPFFEMFGASLQNISFQSTATLAFVCVAALLCASIYFATNARTRKEGFFDWYHPPSKGETSPLRCTDAIDDDAKGENSAAPTKEIGYGALI